MDLGAIVEVAIGIIFVWITLSLATIQIQEWVASTLDKRAKDMEASIHEMLANPNLRSQLYDHPVIRGLTAKKRQQPSIVPPRFWDLPVIRGFTQERRKLPSYIPSQQFALSLFDIAMTAGTESSIIQQGIFKIRDDLEKGRKIASSAKGQAKPSRQEIVDALNILADVARSAAATEAGTSVTNIGLQVLRKQVEEFSNRYPDYKPIMDRALTEARVIKNEIDQVARKQRADRANDPVLDQLHRGIAALSVISPELNQTLNALLLNIDQFVKPNETNLAKARQNIEKWFDDAMDRVSGVFKRYSQAMALLLGIMISFVLNVDSINLTLYLWRDSSVRQVLVANAAKFELPQEALAANPEQTLETFRNQFIGLNLPVGWVIDGGKPEDLIALYDSNCQLFPGENESFGIPFFGTKRCLTPPQSNNETNIALKTIGILLTALAARQGAPFWFDVLKRLVNVRSTGANPAEKEAAK